MESRVFDPAQQAMEYMSHFMEEGNDVIMSHQRWLGWSWFGKVSNHGHDWEIPFAIVAERVARNETPNSCVRVLGF